MKRYSEGEIFPEVILSTVNKPDMPAGAVLKGLTVFWILRYIGCPFCQFDLVLLKKAYERFQALGAQVFVVMQSDKEHIRKAMEEMDPPFEIVCDPDQNFYRKLGIAPAGSEEVFQGDHDRLMDKIALVDGQGFTHGDYEGNELQLPALFIVNEDRKILYAHYAADVLDMPSVDEVLEIIENLK